MSDAKDKADKGPAARRARPPSKPKAAAAAAAAAGAGPGSSSGEDVVYQLARAIQQVAKTREGFTKAVDNFNEIEKDLELRVVVNKKKMDEQEAQRTKEIADLDVDVERQKKRRRLDMEQDLREFGNEAVTRMLGEQGKVAIAAEELAQLREDLAALRANKDESIRKVTSEATERSRTELAARTETLQLRHAAELAAVQARAEQQTNQIKVLDSTIVSLRTELDRQRELTREVAYAQQPRAPPPPPPAAPYRQS